MKTTLILILALVGLSSCTDFTDSPHYHVDPDLQIFVDRFYFEAAKRSKDIGNEMTMVLTNDLNTNFTAIFGLTIHELNEIKIDKNFTLTKLSYKTHEDSLNVEFVVFHEIGHLLLHREHVPWNVYSIMTSDDQWMYDYQTDSKKRKLLIDELFSKN